MLGGEMELTVTIDGDSISIPIDNPFRVNLILIEERIRDFISAKEVDPDGIDVRGLIPRMMRGVAGCERGCPANALDLVQSGFKDFELVYVEGGILTASISRSNKRIYFKMFPDF